MCDTCPIIRRAEIYDESKEIITPYLRGVVNYLPSAQARSNYTPYHLFCLKKNLMSLIRKINGKYDITFCSRKYVDNMIVTIALYNGGYQINPDNQTYELITDNLQAYIDIYPYCLVYQKDDAIKKYNASWCDDILPYIARKNDLLYNQGDIFVNLEDISDYGSKWEEAYRRVTNSLFSYYNRGIVNNPSKQLIRDWQLKRIDIDVYEANWKHKFTYDKIEFLYGKDKRIMLYLGINDKIKTVDGWLTISVTNYSQVVQIMNNLL